MLNNYRHLFYYSVSFGGIYSSCNANMTLGGLATYIPPCLPKECQVEHLWPSSDLPGSPIPDHSHWFREGMYDPSCQHLSPGVFYLEFQGHLGHRGGTGSGQEATSNLLSYHLQKKNTITDQQQGDTRRVLGH